MIIEVEALVKKYKVGDTTIKALDGVSFSVEKGDLVAIRGPSGCGKSTLLNILGCLDVPDSGTYILSGKNVAKLPQNKLAEIRNKYIGIVFQTFNLIPRLTAIENVELPLLYAGKPGARKYAVEALKAVGLEKRMNHEPNRLSGGERQRVAIARALINKPEIILADEPTGNLDSKTGNEIMNIFEELNRDGQTIIIVTHDANIANRCHKQIQMLDGKIIS